MEGLSRTGTPAAAGNDAKPHPDRAAPITLRAGRPWPLGSSWDGRGVNFAVFSAHARSVELCVFAEDGTQVASAPLPGHSHDVWHGHLEGAAPGLIYGFRAHGPWRPERGQRFNAHKLLLDPYAREIVGRFEWRDEQFGADPRHAGHLDGRDNASHALKARVVGDDGFDWGGDTQLHTPLADTVLYEVHVKGFTRQHPEVPQAQRGSYAGLASDAAIAHLKRLGITAVNLLPVQQRIDEQRLVKLGLTNYWGYNTIGFFCVEPRLASGRAGRAARDEFRAMVKRLHEAGIEVILDVVYNHSAESDEHGPTVSFRGLDNAAYYRLQPHHRSHYENPTGCGNTLDLRQPRVLQLVMDSLRWWAAEMHVDGFRFDLAPVLGRTDHGFDARASFFTTLAQDPLLSRLKMIAEPWDIGPGGYQLGGFPNGWLEWNDKFRDTMRSFFIEGGSTRGEFAQRLCASSDVFQPRGRAPAESVNYVVSHDGFTLLDLLSYNHKHNLANGEDNRDGHGHSHNHNFGTEGPSDDAGIRATRARLQRALLTCALLSQGTPMLAAGDELGHTQDGNNNPYCQDNPTTWIDWSRADADLTHFTARVLALRRKALPLENRWYDGLTDSQGRHDLTWLRRDGHGLHGDEWRHAGDAVLGCLIGRPSRANAPLLWLFNAGSTDAAFRLPAGRWETLLDSTEPRGIPATQGSQPGTGQGQGHGKEHVEGGTDLALPSRCVRLLAGAGHGIELPDPGA